MKHRFYIQSGICNSPASDGMTNRSFWAVVDRTKGVRVDFFYCQYCPIVPGSSVGVGAMQMASDAAAIRNQSHREKVRRERAAARQIVKVAALLSDMTERAIADVWKAVTLPASELLTAAVLAADAEAREAAEKSEWGRMNCCAATAAAIADLKQRFAA